MDMVNKEDNTLTISQHIDAAMKITAKKDTLTKRALTISRKKEMAKVEIAARSSFVEFSRRLKDALVDVKTNVYYADMEIPKAVKLQKCVRMTCVASHFVNKKAAAANDPFFNLCIYDILKNISGYELCNRDNEFNAIVTALGYTESYSGYSTVTRIGSTLLATDSPHLDVLTVRDIYVKVMRETLDGYSIVDMKFIDFDNLDVERESLIQLVLHRPEDQDEDQERPSKKKSSK